MFTKLHRICSLHLLFCVYICIFIFLIISNSCRLYLAIEQESQNLTIFLTVMNTYVNFTDSNAAVHKISLMHLVREKLQIADWVAIIRHATFMESNSIIFSHSHLMNLKNLRRCLICRKEPLRNCLHR